MKNLFCVLSLILAIVSQNIAVAANAPVATNSSNPPTSSFTPAQIKEIQQITHSYLVSNPQVLIEAGQELQKREIEEQKAQLIKTKADLPKYKNQLFDTKAPNRVILGNPQGTVLLAEFTQHQCHHCKEATVVVNKLLKNHPEIQLTVIYWPFFGEDAAYTAKAVMAAQKQNKAEELNQAFFANKDSVTKEKADTIIKSIKGLDSKKLYADMATKEFDAGLRENFKLAKDVGIVGTPALVFANKELTKFSLVPGQTPSFTEDLVKALNEVK